ncbi:MAG: S8 family serine peptidase [Anaerolineae bacterium]|nr:S8 family serine peptidase [Anaerolineae bacterium]
MKRSASTRAAAVTVCLLVLLLVLHPAAAVPAISVPAALAPAARSPVERPLAACRSEVYLPLVARDASAGASGQSGAWRASSPASVPGALRAVSTSGEGYLSLRVAYIYGGDTATAEAFRAMLGPHGLHVYPYPAAAAAHADWSACDMVVLGADSGAWLDAAARESVLGAGLPVGAVGAGGAAFLDQAGVLGDLAMGTAPVSTTVQALLRAPEVYRFPQDIPLPTDRRLTLYQDAVADAHSLDLDAPLPNGLEIARLPGTTRFPVVQLGRRFLLWGYDAGPEAMTPVGQDLFTNVLVLQGQALVLPLRGRRFLPPRGVDAALLDALRAPGVLGLHAYVQLRTPPGDPSCADWSTLASHGVTHLYPLYRATHVAYVDAGFDPLDPVVSACLRWVGQILPPDRAPPALLAGEYPSWADNGDGTVNLLARFMPDVSAASAEGVLDALGATHAVQGDGVWAIAIAKGQVAPLAHHDALRWLRAGPAPGEILNDDARSLLYVDEVQDAAISGGSIAYHGLDGSGVTVAIWDNGTDGAHPDLAAHVPIHPDADDHGTHVAGIVGGSGALSASSGGSAFEWRGMAPGATMPAYYFHWDGIEMFSADVAYGMVVSNHSYKMNCGGYDGEAQDADRLVYGNYAYLSWHVHPHLPVYAAGNQGVGAQYCEQVEDDETTGPRGYYSVLSPAKNVLTVGGVERDTGYALRASSSRGPTYDGRIKPEVVAIGCMYSTIPDLFIDSDEDGSDDHDYPYDAMCGTSMASPAVAGIAALVTQQLRQAYADASLRPDPAGLKALLINTATDLVQDPSDPGYTPLGWDCPDLGEPPVYYRGPDFSTGYGVVHARRAVEAAAHVDLVLGSVADGADVLEYTFEVVEGREEIRFTLVWSDPDGDPALDETVVQLVNDLDVALIDPIGAWHYPWVLDPLPASADHDDGSLDPIGVADVEPAYRGMDHRNNVEQVALWKSEMPEWAAWEGTWTLRVSASSVENSTMPQAFALAGEWREIALEDVYPIDAGYYLAPDVIIVPVHVRNPHGDVASAAGGISADDWQVRLGDSASESWIDATVEAAYGPTGDQAYLVVRPHDTLSPEVLYDIQVTLLSAYQVDQRSAETYQPVARAVQLDAVSLGSQPRPPVDEMLVVDNSGSMGDYGKLVSAQNAARAFADRRQAGDSIGLTYFESVTATLYPLTQVSTGETEIDDVKAMIDTMVDLHGTALGAGMLAGKDELESSGVATHTWHMVLVSDGMETLPPCWDTSSGNPGCVGGASIQPEFVSAEGCPAIQVDTVAIGPEEASWRALLEDIAGQTCGDPWNATYETDSVGVGAAHTPLLYPQTLPNTLADIYAAIAEGNTHQQRLWEEVGLLASDETVERAFPLESGLPHVIVAVNWADAAAPLQVALLRPDGTPVSAADPGVEVKTDPTHVHYRLDGPDKGEWRLRLTAQQPGIAEYLAIVSGNTDAVMLLALGLSPPERLPGAAMPIYAVLVDEGGPITGAMVHLAVQQPGGSVHNLALHDDGSHGDAAAGDGVYTNLYLIPAPGGYQLKARAQGIAHDGEAFLRHRMRHVRVAVPPRVAYILDTDSATAGQYASLLRGNGLAVEMVSLVDVASTDLSGYDLLVVGPDTGKDATWGEVAAVEHVSDSLKPVLGLGSGGYALFGALGLEIGYNHGLAASDTGVLALDPTDDVWRTPYDVVLVPPPPAVTVYGGGGSGGVVLNLDPVPADVQPLARQPAQPHHIRLARQGRYLLWGFDLGPAAMTGVGRMALVNAAYYALLAGP